ncbi:uncharacterized protein LOC131597074 [Vicia villosa]|uniref:uncharacterized protein LOC131597074 n=1 Tax=Vicia villosa TaxID=3911 RepID=UPI00273B1FE5|nr:uncharacterized protein LOC131597074 [Vicia villosa]
MEHVDDWWLTAVYASPNDNCKKLLWDSLKDIARNLIGGWMVTGDFNDIDNVKDKKGGLPASVQRCHKMGERIGSCKISNIEMRGTKFTWRGPIFHGGQRIYEKLDRALSNDEWKIQFPDAYVQVLVHVEFFDHHPILINMREENRVFQKHPFRFENWKFEFFDQIKRMKRVVLRRLEGVQLKLQMRDNYGGMRKLEKQVQKELSEILNKEEMMWFQRSRTMWILEEIELHRNIVIVIMHGVTSVETNINWNGNKNEFFRSQRGIRQGDPIYPYLFVLCMDKLSHLIEHAILEK